MVWWTFYGNDDVFSMQELGDVMEKLSSRPSEEELLTMFQLVDENSDGKIGMFSV